MREPGFVPAITLQNNVALHFQRAILVALWTIYKILFSEQLFTIDFLKIKLLICESFFLWKVIYKCPKNFLAYVLVVDSYFRMDGVYYSIF